MAGRGRSGGPKCAGTKANGEPCGALPGPSGYCAFHAKQAGPPEIEYDSEPDVDLVAPDDELTAETLVALDPDELVRLMREDVTRYYPTMRKALEETIEQERVPGLVTCRSCGAKTPSMVIDPKVRLDAIRLRSELHTKFGGSKAADRDHDVDLAVDVFAMSDEERAEFERRLVKIAPRDVLDELGIAPAAD